MDLSADVFMPVAKRIISKADSLRAVKRFKQSGIEGWLKVEAVAAIDKRVVALQNGGPDLVLTDYLLVELKAATDLHTSGIANGALKYSGPCLFLGDGRPARVQKLREHPGIDLFAHEIFSDGENQWIIGIVVPKTATG